MDMGGPLIGRDAKFQSCNGAVPGKESWAVFLITLSENGQMMLAASSEFKKHFPDFDLSSPSLASESDKSKVEAALH